MPEKKKSQQTPYFSGTQNLFINISSMIPEPNNERKRGRKRERDSEQEIERVKEKGR